LFGRGRSQVERDLIASRPEPSARLVKSISARVQPRRETRSRARVGYVVAFSAALLAVMGATGSLGYAASGVVHAATSVSHITRITSSPPKTPPQSTHITALCSQYAVAPIVSGVSPTSAHVGANVTISGSHLMGGDTAVTVTFTSGKNATVVSRSNTALVVTVPTGAVSGPITVHNCAGSDSTGTFTVLPAAPVLNSINPVSGLRGKTITLNGANFIDGAMAVHFGSTASPTVTWVSSTELTAKVPLALAVNAHYNVTVSDSGGTSAAKSYYVTPAPVIASLHPTTGVRGTVVTVSGSDFVSGEMDVLFGSTTLTGTVSSASSLTFTVPSNAAIGASTTVKVSDADGTSAGKPFLTAPAPTLTGISKTTVVRGQSVTLTGANYFSGKMTVLLDTTHVTPVTTTATSITFTVPTTATLGHLYQVKVTDADGTSTAKSMKVAAAPTLTAINAATAVRGQTVTLTGANYVAGKMAVLLDTTRVTPLTTTSTSITFKVPTTATLGHLYQVKVTDADGTSTAKSMKVAPAPTLTSLSPTSGKRSTNLKLTGANYVPGQMKVEFFLGTTLKATVTVASGSTTATTATIVVPSTLAVGSTYNVKIVDGSGISAAKTYKVTG
jgi:hypothetical protein